MSSPLKEKVTIPSKEEVPSVEPDPDSPPPDEDESPEQQDALTELEVLPAEALDDLVLIEDAPEDERESLPARTRDVVPYDPLEAYLREIGRYPPLSREEEREIAVEYYEHRNRDAAYKLISSNLWLVVKIARDYEKAARNLLDLIQEGNIGLMEAVRNFDPYREVRFPSYAVWWIRAYIIRYVIANWRLVKIGTTQAQRKLFFNLKREKERLEKEGFYPGPKLIAHNLNVRESDVIEMEQRMGGSDLSVDAPLPGDADASLLTVLPSAGLNAEEIVSLRQRADLIKRSLEAFSETLNEKERTIFEERLLNEEKATLQDLAERFSISRERIRQIEARVKDKLKRYLIEHWEESIDIIVNDGE
jgi:RNA polymerase sigma-32 factor